MGREGGPGSGSSGFSDGLLRARRWKAPGGKSGSRAATSGALVERLGRRERRRGRPSPGGHPTTTRVSRLLRSGAIERAVRAASSRELGAWTEGPITSMWIKPCRCERRSPPPKEVAAAIARAGRPEREPAARAAPAMESPHRSHGRSSRGERADRARDGARTVPRGSMTRQKISSSPARASL